MLVLGLLLIGSVEARADSRGVLRVGALPVDLAADRDTPLFGGYVDDAVTAYNAAAEAHDVAHGRDDATPTIDAGDLGVRETLWTIAPALEVGRDVAYARFEALLGMSENLRAVGVAIYPFNFAVPLRGGTVTPYLSAGGAATWLDRRGEGDAGGAVLMARAAAGVRVQRVAVEVGYGLFALGGVIDRDELDQMLEYDPRGEAPPPRPDAAIAGGEQRRRSFDVSVGVTF